MKIVNMASPSRFKMYLAISHLFDLRTPGAIKQTPGILKNYFKLLNCASFVNSVKSNRVEFYTADA